MNKKRILIFSLAYHPFIGGAEIALKEITDRISDVNFDLITLRLDADTPSFERMGNVNVYRVGMAKHAPSMKDLVSFPWYITKIFYPLLACVKAWKFHKEKNYDAVWAMMAYAGFAAVLFRMRFPKVPYILTLQEGDSILHITKRWRIRFVAPLLRRVFQTPIVVHAISTYLGEFARSMGYKGKIEVIPNGVEMKKFQNHIQPRRDKIQNKNKIILITTSRLVRKNAIDDVIRALKFLSNKVIFAVLGDGPEKENLQLLTLNLKLGNRVKFFGNVGHDDIPKYLYTADIFVRPSRSEGMGNSFIEAMAADLPIIGTPVGGIPDFLKDGETGLFCEMNNPESIAKQVELLIDDEAFRERLVVNAHKMIEEKYDWSMITADIKKRVFNRVSNTRGVDDD